MEEKRSGWQKVSKPLGVFGIIVVCILIFALLTVIVMVYVFNVNVPGLRGKTLWDWLQLLIIPAVLAVAGYVINLTISRSEREAAEKRADTEYKIALDNQHEAVLQAYIDHMLEILPLYQINEEKIGSLKKIGRIRALTVLQRLDGKRKGNVIQFLYESELIKERVITYIDLSGLDLTNANLIGTNLAGANFSKANLHGANLNKANLNSTNLNSADLSKADLSKADLSKANLHKADLTEANLLETDLSAAKLYGANLTGAKLKDVTGITVEELEKQTISLEGATMPDGSIHP